MISSTLKKRIQKITLGLALGLSMLVFVPLAFAQATPTAPTGATGAAYDGSYCSTAVASITNLADLFKFLTCGMERLVLPLMFTIAGLVFVWGTVKFMSSRDSSEKEEGQQFMLWGVISFAVMLSLWGLVNILGVTFHLTTALPAVPPTTQIQ